MVARRFAVLMLLALSIALPARADVFPYETVAGTGRNNVVDSNAASCDSVEGCYTNGGARCSDNPNQLCDLQIVPVGRCTYGDLSTGLASCVWPHQAGHCDGNPKVGCLTSTQCSALTPTTCSLTTDVFGAAYAAEACTCQGTNSVPVFGNAPPPEFETVRCGGSISVCSDGDLMRNVGGRGIALGLEVKLGGPGSQTIAAMGPAVTGSSKPDSSPAYALENPPISLDPQRHAGSVGRTPTQGIGPIHPVRATGAREITPYVHPTLGIGNPVNVRKSELYGDSAYEDWSFGFVTVTGTFNRHIVSYSCDTMVDWITGTPVNLAGQYCHEAARNGLQFIWSSDLNPAQVAAYTSGGKRICPPNCNKDFHLSTTELQEIVETGLQDPNAGIQLAIESGEEAIGRQAGAGDSIGVSPITWIIFAVDNDLRCRLGGWGNPVGEIGRCSDGAMSCVPGIGGDFSCIGQGSSCRACNGPITAGNPLGLPIGYNTHGRMELDLIAGQRIGGIAGAPTAFTTRIPLFVVETSGNAASDFRDIPGEGLPLDPDVDVADMGSVDPLGLPFGSGIGAGGTFINGVALNIDEPCCSGGSNLAWDAAQLGSGGTAISFSYTTAPSGAAYPSTWALTYDKGPGPDGIPGCIGDNGYVINGAMACNQRLGVGPSGAKTDGAFATGKDDRALVYPVGAVTIPASSPMFTDYGDALASTVAYFGSAQNPPTTNSVAAFTVRDLGLLVPRSLDVMVKLNTTACPLTAFGPQCSMESEPCSLLGGDTDGDTLCNDTDNCPLIANFDQLNSDGDTLGNVCDNCALVTNQDQADVDGDLDGNVCDNCATVVNSDQADGDADLVGNLCDSCVTVVNARPTTWTFATGSATYLTAQPWATMTGGQRDDDHDGYGNTCDADFPGSAFATNVNASDTAQFKASTGSSRALDICGTNDSRPCAIYDIDANNFMGPANINAADTARYKALLLLGPKPPKCALCPLPCEAGTAGNCF